ncbi:MAG: hypothetical protein ACXWJK_03895, partial [Burkholderiaceae bacterium]
EKILRLQIQATIQSAMKKLIGDSYVEQPKDVILFRDYAKLDHLQLWQGIRAFLLECNIEHGSTADVDIYKLVGIYLWNEEARAEINDVVKNHGH